MKITLIGYTAAYVRLFFVLCIASVGYFTDWMSECLGIDSGENSKLLHDSVNNSVCSITFDESVSCVFVVWKRYATSDQLRFTHESVLQLLKKHGATKVLGDDTALPTIHPEDQSWIVEDWIPRAQAVGLKCAASKSPNSHLARVSVKRVQSSLPAGLIARSFENLNDARHWLQTAS